MSGPQNGDPARLTIPTIAEIPGWGVILLAHGSQRGTSRDECSCSWQNAGPNPPSWCLGCTGTNQGLQTAVGLLQDALASQGATVILSCLEFIEPHPGQALQILHEQGLERVVLLPFLLGNGKHATLELDEILADAQTGTPGLEVILAQGLGSEPEMAELVLERVRSMPSLQPLPSSASDLTGVMLVKAGTKSQYDDCEWLVRLSGMVEAQLGQGYAVAAAQSHYGDPTMDHAAAELVENRRVSRMVVVPYVFFPGMILRRNVLGNLERLGKTYPGLPISVTPPLGVDQRVIQVAANRVRQAWKPAPEPG